ncbi:MAG TPA: type I-B CRISPR-associated protein Cas7/Cst2/DevR [Pyrinomonadaceae bacterium]|nr:type I-B CRISPR-associated protein Cas7/Cst2/DevR [Pyrinomonadaceae bacterium]
MATNYLYGTVLTSGEQVAANNRGDTLGGNTTTLQKIFLGEDVHTTVSAEAIRFALRYRFQLQGLNVNRKYIYDRGKYELRYNTEADEKREYWKVEQDEKTLKYISKSNGEVYIDDDIMGFMVAKRGQEEKEDAEKGAKIWSSPLAIGRAISLRPYRGELSFNCVSGKKTKGELSLYNAEMHTTEYQYFFGLNLNNVIDPDHVDPLLDAILDPPPVAGNHARFAYDFSPDSIVLRVTNAHSSRIQNCFEVDADNGSFSVTKLVDRVRRGDIPTEGLIVGGELADSANGLTLEELGVRASRKRDGVRFGFGAKEALEEAKRQIAELQKLSAQTK